MIIQRVGFTGPLVDGLDLTATNTDIARGIVKWLWEFGNMRIACCRTLGNVYSESHYTLWGLKKKTTKTLTDTESDKLFKVRWGYKHSHSTKFHQNYLWFWNIWKFELITDLWIQ